MDSHIENNSDDPVTETGQARKGRGYAFWMVLFANWTCDFLSALDLTAMSTALPTIAEHLNGVDFIWAGSAYAIASTAILPLCGGLASAFGRKPVLLTFLVLFALGSAICGAAQNMNMLIAGRVVQGLGGGGCMSLTEIIFSDLVPLPERGSFLGITASVWALACAIGPPIGGALASSGTWRWLFFLNIPICGIAFTLQTILLHVKTPTGNVRDKLRHVDIIGWYRGNTIIIGSTIAVTFALVWGGLEFSWNSFHVLIPLCVGIVFIVIFLVYEVYVSTHPTMPWSIVSNCTSISGYLGTFIHAIPAIAVIYYLPVYLQATKLASPIQSGVDTFGISFTVAPFAIICGVMVQVFKKYVPFNYVGWILMIIGFGLLTLLDEKSWVGEYVGFQIVTGAGVGLIWASTQFAVLAPLPFSNNANALAFYTFTRAFSQTWGITIGGAILQNQLHQHLPPNFTAIFPAGTQIAYAAIPKIGGLDQPIRDEVQAAFAKSVALIWKVMAGISGVGLLSCVLMKEVPMRTDLDEQWALQDRDR